MEQKFHRNLDKNNWQIFKSTLEAETWPELDEKSNLDEMADMYQSKVMAALNNACPLKPILGRKPNKWWNKELDKLRSK